MTSQRALSLTIREFEVADYDRLVEIYNSNYPDYALSASEQRARDENVDRSKYLLKRFACIDRNNARVLGFGGLSHVLDMYHPRKFIISIYVDPSSQRMGVGSIIYEKLVDELRQHRALVAWTSTKEDIPNQRAFFEKRGFLEKSRAWESRLDLLAFDRSKFAESDTDVASLGIRFTNLGEVRREGMASMTRLHELVQFILEDMPREAPFTPISYDQWEALELNSPRLLPEGYVIAKKDSEYVGLSVVYRNEKEPSALSQGDTGVKREYRGRGLATALKLRVIDFARAKGYLMIKTWNDSTNARMLAVNTKLGFKRQVGWTLMEKSLNSEAPGCY